MGSLCSDFEREPMHGVIIGTGFVLLGLALVYWLPATGFLMIIGAVLGLLIGGGNRRERDNSGAERFYRLMATPVGREQELVDAGVDVVYAGESEGHPWELNHPRMVQWGGFAVACCFTLVVLGLLYWIAGLGR
ncbi:MAG: hypothetical protein HZB16_08285 [Armatimonadetes bacterium]|nr:hypothetical protein [Armatimonadota bacterium]